MFGTFVRGSFYDTIILEDIVCYESEDADANEVRKVSRDKLKENELKEKINEYLVGESFSFTRNYLEKPFLMGFSVPKYYRYPSTSEHQICVIKDICIVPSNYLLFVGLASIFALDHQNMSSSPPQIRQMNLWLATPSH